MSMLLTMGGVSIVGGNDSPKTFIEYCLDIRVSSERERVMKIL